MITLWGGCVRRQEPRTYLESSHEFKSIRSAYQIAGVACLIPNGLWDVPALFSKVSQASTKRFDSNHPTCRALAGALLPSGFIHASTTFHTGSFELSSTTPLSNWINPNHACLRSIGARVLVAAVGGAAVRSHPPATRGLFG
jgi:hypothetical protein